jgi:hypothetical protein
MDKRKILMLCLFLGLVTEAMAQVTIGAGIAPGSDALLDLKENSDGTSRKGLLLPRVALSSTTLPGPMSAHIPGMLVYNTATEYDVTPGAYYNDGDKWTRLEAMEPWMVSGTTDKATSNTQDIYQMGSIAIGTASPDPSAILELNATDKGFLGTRVALTGIYDRATIPNPADGLLAYCTGKGGLNYTGYVFWNGVEWRTLSNASLAPGTLGSITCNSAQLTPSIYKAGEYYEGTLVIPYTGSNGGVYQAQSIGPVNGLTATLASGNFNVGAGNLVYNLTGTPSVSTPTVTVFTINIGGQTCEASVGAGDGIAPGDLVFYGTTFPASTANVWMSDYAKDLPVIGGKLRLDAWFGNSSNGGDGSVTMWPRLVNISDSPVKFWFSAITTVDHFNASNYLIASGGDVELDNGIYYGYGYNDILGVSTPRASGSGQGGHQEVVTVDLALDDKWYRIYYFPTVDNMNTTSNVDNLRRIYLSIQRLY